MNTLVATSKANGGIRPIGIGEALRRFVCRLSLTVLKDPLEELLHPTQFCAGTKGGLAAVANMQRLFHEKDTNAITVQTDVKNAFGSVSWTMLFRAVDTYAPMLSGILRVLYKDKSCLYHRSSSGTRRYTTDKGVQQGCGLSMHFFCMVSHAIHEKLMPEFPDVFCQSIADDSYYTASDTDSDTAPELLQRFLRTLEEGMKRYAGLTLRPDKFRVLSQNRDATSLKSYFPDIREDSQICHNGLIVAGIPVGVGRRAEEYERSACNSILRQPDGDAPENIFTGTLAKGRTIESAILATEKLDGRWQARHLLLRLCVSPMPLHLLQACSLPLRVPYSRKPLPYSTRLSLGY